MATGSMDMGQVTNLMSMDAYKVQDQIPFLPNIIIAPVGLIYGKIR